jgi:protoporphyrinogen oxidase
MHSSGERVHEVELDTGERLHADLVISSIPTAVYFGLAPDDATPHLREISYSGLLSMVCASKKAIEPDFYWMNLADLDRAACGIFLLNSLNPTIGAPGDSCVNFVTHLNSRTRPFFAKPEEQILDAYLEDFKVIFGFDLDPFWVKLTRVPMYSPVIGPKYRNPPVRSTRFGNVYFAGNYRTFPSIVSTGTALASGLEAAQAVLRDKGTDTPLPDKVAAFRM